MQFKDEIKEAVFGPHFVSLRLRGRGRYEQMLWNTVNVRPVLIKNRKHIQFSFLDEKKDITKNFKDKAALFYLSKILSGKLTLGLLVTTNGKKQYEFSERNKVRTHEHKSEVGEVDLSHDHSSLSLIPITAPYLKKIGIASLDNKIIADKKSKWKQVLEIIRQIEDTCDFSDFNESSTIVDFGCGNAYLTFSIYYYFHFVKKIPVIVTGLDRNKEIINANIKIAKECGFEKLNFENIEIDNFSVDKTDMVVALHACDTATDDSLAKAIKSNAKYVFVSPCCHHHLHQKIKNLPESADLISYDPIFRVRLIDMLTDSFRSSILKSFGYRTQIIQFVEDSHTPRNVLIKAVKNGKLKEDLSSYGKLKEKFNVTPYLGELVL